MNTFVMCDSCRKRWDKQQGGLGQLCKGCVQNRDVIYSLKRKDKDSFIEVFTEMALLGLENDAMMYEIAFRNAGVGVCWHEKSRVKGTGPNNWKEGLVTYKYYDDMVTMVQAELARLKEKACETAST